MMIGRVDDYGRALVSVTICHPDGKDSLTVDAWIDTGFSGGLVLTAAQIKTLGLPWSSTVPATLADGTQVVLDTYTCLVEWLGDRPTTEVIAGAGQLALLGVGLLVACRVVINYPARTVEITSTANGLDQMGQGPTLPGT
jgi:clan AA aspartic protease